MVCYEAFTICLRRRPERETSHYRLNFLFVAVIYAIHALGTDFVKFGKASHVGRRLSGLQTSSPFELRLLASANWPNYAESQIFRLAKRERVRGEWYRLGRLSINIISLMKEEGGWGRFEEIFLTPPSMAYASDRLEKIGRQSKEDLGVWITRLPEDVRSAHTN